MSEDIHNTSQQSDYWTQRYEDKMTGWDIGYPSTPIKEYVDQLEDKSIDILIPGAGNGYEAEYLYNQGFVNTHILDISRIPLKEFESRMTDFPKDQLICENFFSHHGQYDLIIEQTFFCSFPPHRENRINYAYKMHKLLKPKGRLVGLWFDMPLTGDLTKRPFGGSKKEYLGYFKSLFETKTFERCYNSIGPRQDNELFGIFVKK